MSKLRNCFFSVNFCYLNVTHPFSWNVFCLKSSCDWKVGTKTLGDLYSRDMLQRQFSSCDIIAPFYIYEICNKLLLCHIQPLFFGCRKELQRSTIWIDFRQTIVTMQFFTSRWGVECKLFDHKMTGLEIPFLLKLMYNSSSWSWNKDNYTKEVKTVIVCGYLIYLVVDFCDLIFPILFFVTLLDGFWHIGQHVEVCQNCSARRHIFSFPLGIWICGKMRLLLLIL